MKFNHQTQLILVLVASILGTIFVLHANGYLRHSKEQDALYVAEFSLLASAPGMSGQVSHKSAGFVARCDQGFLVMDAVEKVSKTLSGVVVDRKNRPVRCQ